MTRDTLTAKQNEFMKRLARYGEAMARSERDAKKLERLGLVTATRYEQRHCVYNSYNHWRTVVVWELVITDAGREYVKNL